MEELLKKEGEFEYIEQGEGEVVLLLHGLFGALSNFKDVVEHFSSSYKVVIPQLPLYTLPIINTSVKSLEKFLRKFIDYKGYERVNLVGNSLGGHVALAYVAKDASKVNSLCLTGSSGLYENAFGGSFPRREDKEYLREKIAVTFYDPKHATDELVEDCYGIVNDRGCLVRILALAKSAIRHNMEKDLPKISLPTCLIWGENDTITPPDVARQFNELIPDSDLFWIPQCGHAAMMEHPNTFNLLLEDWYKKRGI